MTSFGTKTAWIPTGPSAADTNSIATSTASKHAQRDGLAQATALLLLLADRLSSQRARMDAIAQWQKNPKEEGSEPHTETRNKTQSRRARERKTIQTIESTSGSTALPSPPLLQQKSASNKAGTLLCCPPQGPGLQRPLAASQQLSLTHAQLSLAPTALMCLWPSHHGKDSFTAVPVLSPCSPPGKGMSTEMC